MTDDQTNLVVQHLCEQLHLALRLKDSEAPAGRACSTHAAEVMHKFPLFLPLSRPYQALGCSDRPFDWEL